MASIRTETYRKSRRNRECWYCGGVIKKGERYAVRETRYDKTIISFYWHDCSECKPKFIK